MEATTEVCRLCHFPAELDDVALRNVSGRYICLLCFERETEMKLPFPQALRRQIETILFEMNDAAA